MSMWGQIMLQDANSPIMENMIMFYDFSMIIIVLVVAMIMYLLFFMLFNKLIDRFLLEGQMIEIIWTVIPIIFLIFLAIPSLKLLYLSDEINNPIMSIKVLGHQWYWSYEFNDFKSINFDSFMIKDDKNNLFRLLDVDNRLILPFNYQIRFLISSLDVIHSFTIPSLGSKVDAVPGRINQINLFMKRPGIYFGQCSEICGVNHSFMPIVIESTSLKNFINWINKI
uniref:Cytochrome c oxidase subunit 2 n=2 Tax=unclassified Philotrypesis TaxID=2646978 RepID=G8EEI7_9HYME|nr:cytochrome c oxidase subunit II [Philotrypesis sp. JHX-2011]